jgi:predicted nucleic acid-binding protein
MSKVIISDTSCLIALDRIGRIDLLQKTFTTIYTTKIVAEEFEKPLPNWITIKDVVNIRQVEKLKFILDAGEASAIALALETENSVLIIDEKKGRKIARDLNVTIIGTLKVLLIAKNKGVIVSVKQIINELQKQSFRFNSTILEEVLKQAGEI